MEKDNPRTYYWNSYSTDLDKKIHKNNKENIALSLNWSLCGQVLLPLVLCISKIADPGYLQAFSACKTKP